MLVFCGFFYFNNNMKIKNIYKKLVNIYFKIFYMYKKYRIDIIIILIYFLKISFFLKILNNF